MRARARNGGVDVHRDRRPASLNALNAVHRAALWLARFGRARRHRGASRLASPQPLPRDGRVDRSLLYLALSALALVLVSGLAALPLLLVFVPLGSVFPLVQFALSLARPYDTATSLLPWTLSGIYAALLLAMLLLLPSVRRFQSLRVELLPTHALPSAFLCAAVPREMSRRLAVAQSVGFNSECSVCCERIDAHDATTVLQRCSHAFHTECLALWIQENPTCPNCRQPALPSELTMVPFPLDACGTCS